MKFPLLVLFATGALSAPFFDTTSFNAYFLEDDCSDPRLRDDATSIFSYAGETINTVQGSTSDSTGLKLKAVIYIHPLGACKYRMQINNPELLVKSKNNDFQTAPESRKFSKELQAQDLVFQTSRGRINKLFPAAGESLHILNIKRGILSTLQLQKDAEEEVDVHGKCKVKITESNGVTVKSKDLSECSDRALNELGLQTASFAHSKMPIKPLNSKSVCEYITENDKIIAVECEESHLFRPFSAGYKKPAGAITKVTQKLKLEGTKGRAGFAVETKSKSNPVSLIYGHEQESMKPDNSIVTRIDSVMESLVKMGSLSAKQSSAHEFVELVNLVRKLDSKRMRPVMDKYFNFDASDANLKGAYRQFFLDALTYCGTPTCVSTVHDVIISGDVSGECRNMFLQGVSLVAKPTKQMIRDLLNIAKTVPSRQAFLSLGILMNRYCKLDSASCAYSKSNPVTFAELFLEAKLGNSCEGQENHERVEEILMAIKAIGNAGQPVKAIETLVKCAMTAEHMNITTAALDALRRMPCNEKAQAMVLGMYEDVNVDVEKRIQAYITAMNCPTESTLIRVVNKLQTEESKQVGSFVWSHIKNIQESSEPKNARTKELLSKILEGKELKNFDLSFVKFSKAFEGSIYSEYLKSGATVNGHLIYNPESFVPRSSLVSMSANILDVPVEVFEMAARIEGVESIAEDFFGPYGYFPDDTIMKFFNVNIQKEDLEKLRSRRSVDQGYESTINDIHQKVKRKRQPNGSLTMKVLGHEMRVFSYDDLQWAADEIDNMNVIELLLKVAKGGHKTFTKSIMFLEMTHTVPTGLGLPLKLKLTGSAVGSLEIDGKFDIRNMFWGPMALEVKGSLKPSTVVEVSGQMGVNSHYIDTGIFVNSSMYTSQVVKGSVLYREGQQLKINVDAPEKPIEFFNISTTPFTYVNEDIKLIEGAERRISPDFCMNSTMIIGLGLCTRVSVPVAFRDYEAPYYPLSGPASFGLKLVKADPKLTTYQFLVSLTKKQITSGSELIGTFQVGTPGASYSRGMSGSIKYKETSNIRELTIGSTEAARNAQLKITYQNNTNRFEVNFDTNVFTPKPISARILYFNSSSYLAKEMGILMSASYDWYTLQHVTKFVRKQSPTKSYLFHTRTTYWPKRHLTGEFEYSPVNGKISMRFDSNQFNQRAEFDGQYISTETEKGFDFALAYNNVRRVSFYTGVVNTDAEKKLVFNVKTSSSKPVELVWGYFRTSKGHEVKFVATAFGKSGEIFADYSNLRSGWHGMNLGGKFQERAVGLTASYNNEGSLKKEACVVAYFDEKRPAKTCLSLKNKELTWSIEVMKKTAAVLFVLDTTADRFTLGSVLTVQEKEVMKNALEMTYRSLFDNELKLTMSTLKHSVMSRIFSTPEGDQLKLFGVEAKGFGQLLKMQAKYSTLMKNDYTVRGIVVEGWVNKKLPVSYTLLFETSDSINGIKTVFDAYDYSAKAVFEYGMNNLNEHLFVTELAVTRKQFVLLGSKTTEVLLWGDSEKAYKQTWDLTVWNKKFTYGFDVNYENLSTETKSEYAMIIGATYAKNKRSTLATVFSNTEASTQLSIDVNYLPGRQLQHMITYYKGEKKLAASIEFLPKMFVTLSGKINKINGWQLKTDMKLSWRNFERTFDAVAAYVDQTDLKGLNFQLSAFEQDFAVGSQYDNQKRTLKTHVTVLGRTAQLLVRFDKALGIGSVMLGVERNINNRLVMKELVKTVLKFTKPKLSLEIDVGKTSLFKVSGILEQTQGSINFVVMQRSIVKTEAVIEGDRVMANIFVLGKLRMQTVGRYNTETRTALLSFDFLRKNMRIVFSGKWNPDLKQVTVATDLFGQRLGLDARFDPFNYAAGFHIFNQKSRIGWSVFYNKDLYALVFKLDLAPKLSANVLMQLIDDRIISLNVQREAGGRLVNEITMKYELSPTVSKFALDWNKESAQKIKDMILPVSRQAMKQVTEIISKAKDLGQTFSMVTIENIGKEAVKMIRVAEKKFDEFDFVAARDKMGEVFVKGLKKSAGLAQKALELSSDGLMEIHNNLPMAMKKMEKVSLKALELSRFAMAEGMKMTKATYESLKDVIEAGRPVAKLAWKLAKEFKIQGKTAEQIAKELMMTTTRIIQSYKENMSKKMDVIIADMTKYVRSVKFPFTDAKVYNLIVEYVKMIRDIDFEQKAREITRMIKDYLEEIKQTVNNLPEELKTASIKLIKYGRKQATKLTKVVKKLKTYFQPMVNCIEKIARSTQKNFGPLVEKAVKKVSMMLKAEFNRLYLPLKAIATQVWMVVKEFAMPLVKPIRPLFDDIKQQIRAIRLLEKEIGVVFDFYMKKLSTFIELRFISMYAKTAIAVDHYSEAAKKLTSMTLEEMAEATIDMSTAAIESTVNSLKEIVAERKKIIATLKDRSMKMWKVISDLTSIAMSRPVEDMVIQCLKYTEKYSLVLVKELAQALKQISKIDIATPLRQAWIDMDLLNHLGRYGVNKALNDVIEGAKKINIAESVVKALKKTKETVEAFYKKLVDGMKELEVIVKYVKSIPKKDFDAWYLEVEAAMSKAQKTVSMAVSESYEKVADFYKKVSQKLVEFSKRMNKDYIAPLKLVYALVKQRAELVYDEVKDDCAVVYEIYKGIVYGAAKENYEKVKRALETQYKKLYDELTAFYKKYEDKTWEEISMEIYGGTKQAYTDMYEMANRRYEKASELTLKVLRKAQEIRNKIERLVKDKGMKWFNEEFKPKAVILYNKLADYTREMYNAMRKMSIDAYNEMYARVIKLYENNKYLSIRQLAKKVEVIFKEMAQKYKNVIKKLAKENYTKVKSFMMKLKVSFEKEVLPILKEEAVSIIDQSLRASVMIAEETIKAFNPQFIALKNYLKRLNTKLESYYERSIVLAKKFYKYVKETAMEMYEKGSLELEIQYKKMFVTARKMIKEIEEHPKYQELVKTEMFIKSKEILRQLTEFVAKKIEELKSRIEVMKTHPKVAELRKQIMGLKDHETVKQIMSALSTGKESFVYTARKLQDKMRPYIARAVALTQDIPELATQKVTCFRADPVTCFWKDIEMLKNIIYKVMSYDLKELKAFIVSGAKEIAHDVTDENAKQLYLTLKTKGTKLYEELVRMIKTLPRDLKDKCTQFCAKQMTMLKEQYNKIVAQWKMSPLYSIFANEIWTEIAEEIMSHEIVVEMKSLAKYGALEASLLYRNAVKYAMDLTRLSRAKIVAKYNEMMQKFNELIDETTLADIVEKAKDIKKKVMTEFLDKAIEYYGKAITAVNERKERYIAFTKKQMALAQSFIEKEYPKVLQQVKLRYAEYMKMIEEAFTKGMEKIVEAKDMAVSKATKMWMESTLRATMKKTMKMTVGETVAELMKIPGDARKMYRDMAEMVIMKYHIYAQPYVQTTVNAAKFIANEVNETIVFLVRYYDLQGAALRGYKMILSSVPKVPVMAKKYLIKATKTSLKAVHSSLVYADKLDLSMDKLRSTLEKMRNYVPDITKYVTVKVGESGVSLSFIHPEVTPSFKHHANNAKQTVVTYTDKVKTRTMAISKTLLAELKARTMELRSDLNQSFLAHTRLGKRIGSIVQNSVLRKKGSVKTITRLGTKIWKNVIEEVAKDIKETTKKTYLFTSSAILAVLDSESIPEAYEKSISYFEKAVKEIKPYFESTKKFARFIRRLAKKGFEEAWGKVKPYYVTLREAGVSAAYSLLEDNLRDAFKKAINQFLRISRDMVEILLTKDDLKVVQDYTDVHTGILGKYAKRLFRFYKWNKIMLDRTIRKSKMRFLYQIFNPLKRRVDPFRTYAMIYGKRHVMTFDGKYYEFPKHPKSTCTYLLARDVVNGNFTILAQAEKIIAETPDAKISIDKSGVVEGAIKFTKAGITRSERLRGIPVETDGVTCKRYRHYIKCEFKHGVTLKCNVKHFLCSIELSGWHYGKSQGLLGTNNREIYDDLKLVNQKMTNSLDQLANSWLVTRSSDCYVKEANNEAPMCNKTPSEKCIELFKSKSSPFARYFSAVDPLSFLKTCQIDTADCEDSISFCDSVAAYRTALKMRGIYPKNTKECGSKTMGKTFTVQPKKAIDVVVLMSARKSAITNKKTIASMLYNTNKKLRRFGYDARYALISYGAAAKGAYGSRSHTFNGKFFSSDNDVATAIKNMAYIGEKTDINDYNEAILRATRQPFRPDAARMIILFKFDTYSPSWFGPTTDETKFALKYEANASLFVFNDFDFKDFQKGIFSAIGITRKNVYMTPTLKIDPLSRPLPKTPFTRYIHRSGGLFANKLSKSSEKVFTAALADAMIKDARDVETTCRRCVGSWHGFKCLTDNTVKC